jgi:hypothetical protein
MQFRNVTLAALALAFATVAFAQQDSGFQSRYAANLASGESYINITNTGANGAPALGPGLITGLNGTVGNICVNVYAIDPNEELVSCCSCLVTPDATLSLGVIADLVGSSGNLTNTGQMPPSVTVVLAASLAGGAGGTGTSCTDSAALVTSVANGMAAWMTTLHAPPVAGAAVTTETSFTPISGGAGGTGSNLASLAGRCASIIGNSSSHGLCAACVQHAQGGNSLF